MTEKLESLKREINKGIEAIENGNFRVYDSADEMIEEILNEVQAEFEKNRKRQKT